MSETFELGGKEYEMTGNPSLRTVRHVQNMQMDMIMKYVDEEDLREMDSLEEESEIIQAILDSGGMSALQNVMWERSLLETVQTISLACDEVLDIDDIEDFPALEFKHIKQAAEDEIGGTASDFFNELGIGTVLSEEEMNRQAAQT